MEKESQLSGKNIILGIQHMFAMFGATVLVPIITGFNISSALVCAGLGTLLFHMLTKHKVPVFLGSSFAFIPAISMVVGNPAYNGQGVQYAQGGIIAAGILYVIVSLIIAKVGVGAVKKLFPPVVTGPVIIVIGLGLSYFAVNRAGLITAGNAMNAGGVDWIIAAFVVCVVVGVTIFAKGFPKLIPVLIGMVAGYVLCIILKMMGVFTMDFSAVVSAPWLNIPYVTADMNNVPFFSLPKFDFAAILAIAPMALITLMEHIGDITTNGMVVGKDFLTDPGLKRTVLGDGVATMLAGFLGGPANTTYSENTGVLATTKNYNPFVLKIAAVFAILLGFVGKFGAVLQTIPAPVMGGVGLILFGTIAAVGMRTLVEAKIDFSSSRNLIIVALITVLGVGITIATYLPAALCPTGIVVSFGSMQFNFSGLFVAVIVGVVANMILPEDKK